MVKTNWLVKVTESVHLVAKTRSRFKDLVVSMYVSVCRRTNPETGFSTERRNGLGRVKSRLSILRARGEEKKRVIN